MRCPGVADPVVHGQASAVLEPTPHVSGLSGDVVEIFWATRCTPSTPRGRQLLVWRTSRPCPVVGASRRCTCAVGPSNRLCLLAVKPRSLVQFVIRMVSEKSERNCSSRLRVILRHLSTHTLLQDERLSTALSTLREHLLDMAFRFWHGGFWILLHAL